MAVKDLRGRLIASIERNKILKHGEIFTLSSADGKSYVEHGLAFKLSSQGEESLNRNELLYQRQVLFPYDTRIYGGQLLLTEDGQKWLIESFLPIQQWNEIIQYQANLRLASFLCDIYRPPNDADRGYSDVSAVPSSATTRNGVECYFNMSGLLPLNLTTSPIEMAKPQLLICNSEDIQIGDQINIKNLDEESMGYFKVLTLDKASFPNLYFCTLNDDTRVSQ